MSEEKIIARRNKLIEWTKTQDIRCTPFCETINENINSINYLLHELQQKENIIKEVREKIEGVTIYGLRSGKTLIATLLNEILEILDKRGE